MSIVVAPAAAHVGPRNVGQQVAKFKWKCEVAGGYWLYFGAPESEVRASTRAREEAARQRA